jgi:Cu+-exporting ATPase
MGGATVIDRNQASGTLVTELAVTGMSCSNCARHVAEAIKAVPGVARASVRLEEGRASVVWDAQPKADAVIAAVGQAGYDARLAKTPSETEARTGAHRSNWSPFGDWRFNVVVGLVCTLPLIVGEWIFGFGANNSFHWIEFALALPVQALCGARFYSGAWRQLKTWSTNMDTLVALGSTTAFAYSVWALFTGAGNHLYFMEAAAIITLISLGHWAEARTSAKAEGSLQALLRLAPQTARRRRSSDGREEIVAVNELLVNDTIALKPGDQVPTDGELLSGESTVDESMLTGESIPAEKNPGATLYAGTANLNGHAIMRVTATGESTALAHIIAAVERAQNSRAEIQRLGDRVSSVFVPIVVLIALDTGLWWAFAPDQARAVTHVLEKFLWPAFIHDGVVAVAFIQAAAVLIVACPCAMGLATPAAIMAGTNAAARLGILIRDGIALERAGRITALIFDKTGTITLGKPVAVDTLSIGDGQTAAADGIRIAAALARGSNHPISQAVAKLHADELPFTAWEEIRGSGVQARLSLTADSRSNPVLARLGRLSWLRECGVQLEPDRAGAAVPVHAAKAFEEKWSSQGATILGIAADEKLLGVLAVRDDLKPGAAGVVRQLRNAGLEIYLVTGDNGATAKAIAKQAGIAEQNVFAEVRPEGKAEFVQDLRRKGARVAFVGDGINDAPALEAADLGIAVSRASDIAREAADIILLNSEIEAVPEALALSRATLRTIKQNLFWAFFYNSVGVPLAALGFMSPLLCALAMGLSDLVVIGNALRLLRWRMGKRA